MDGAAVVGRGIFGRSSTEWRHTIFGINPKWTLARVICWWIFCSVVFQHCVLPVKIVGSSMAPTYSNGSLNIINRLCYQTGRPNRGDVIALHSEGEVLLKRIIAMPGESVSIHYGIIYVNDRPVADDFSHRRVPWEVQKTQLRQNEYFVIGDNRETSVFGAVDRSQIIGKTLF
ncbi:MAG TPA: signal peptidase I [Methylomirabilota bacterium]|nr:signal peptidase I [Methylomirabilota bacterium]